MFFVEVLLAVNNACKPEDLTAYKLCRFKNEYI
jgi:hypothetical protein